jgi:integrase
MISRWPSSSAKSVRAPSTCFNAQQSGNPYPPAAIRLLLLTGCRKGEIANLRWDHVDFERQCLRLPDSKTGAKVVYLNAPARALLQELPRMAVSPRVIPGLRADGAGSAIDKVWSRVRKAAGLADVRLHDLRHSFASVGAAGGLSLPIIGALLGHSTRRRLRATRTSRPIRSAPPTTP